MRHGSAIYATKLLKQSAKNAGESSATNTLDYAAPVENISAQNVSPLRASLTRVLSATAARNSNSLQSRLQMLAIVAAPARFHTSTDSTFEPELATDRKNQPNREESIP